jgi:hypothetical protein
MNRSLLIPACACAIGFAALLASLHGASPKARSKPDPFASLATSSSSSPLVTSEAAPLVIASKPATLPKLSADEAEQVLAKLTDEYLRPWRQWQRSPQHSYSRAGIERVPSISAAIELAGAGQEQGDSVFMGTVTITTGLKTEAFPCVVDRDNKHVWLCASGQWQTSEGWLASAPAPFGYSKLLPAGGAR